MSALILFVRTPQLSRSKALALTGLASGLVGSLGLAAMAFAAPGDVLPNLQAELPYASERYVDFNVSNGKPYYRFDSVIRNAGAGALEFVGVGNGSGTATLQQVFYGPGGTPTGGLNAGVAPVAGANNVSSIRSIPGTLQWAGIGIAADNHNHWHVAHAARYELRTPGSGGQVVGTAAKVGFCMYDTFGGSTYTWPGGSNSTSNWCQHGGAAGGGPSAPVIRMGIAPNGGGDIYARDLSYQWLDINSVDPGNYNLVATVDPDGFIEESNNGDNVESQSVTIPGVKVSNVTAPTFGAGSVNNTIVLPPASVFGEDVPVKLEKSTVTQTFNLASLVSGTKYYYAATPDDPAEGTITSNDGDRNFVYTPKPGFVGTDTFSYFAADPRGFTSFQGIVTVNVGQITVSPNSPRIETSQTQQFTATSSAGLPANVTWAVDGVTGGNSIVGTISSSGLYTAPAAKGSHVVKATSTSASAVFGESPIDVGVSPAVAISPKTGALLTGQTLQFSTTVIDAPTPVTFSVSGIAGGDGSVGTITATGLYTAPVGVPKVPVSVRATLVGRPLVFDDAALTITAPAVPVPPATVPPVTVGTPNPPKSGKRLARIVIIGKSGSGVRVRVKLDRSLGSSRVTIQARDAKRKFTSWIGTRRATGTTINLVLPLRGRNSVAVRAYVRSGKRKIFSAPVVISAKRVP